MLKKTLHRIVKEGVEHSRKYLAVEMRMEGSASHEIILTPRESIEGTMQYYDSHFNDNLEAVGGMFQARRARIVDAMMVDDLRDFSAFFV